MLLAEIYASVGSTPTILVIATRRIGDVLLTTPLIAGLKNRFPHSAIDVLVFSGTQGILRGNPHIRNIITTAERASVFERMKQMCNRFRQYGLAISTLPGDRPVLYAMAAAKKSISVLEENAATFAWKSRWLNAYVPYDAENSHVVLNQLQLLGECDIDNYAPCIYAESTLPAKFTEKSYVVCHPFPKFAYKLWNSDQWRVTAHALAEKGFSIVVTGSNDAQEKHYLRELTQSWPPSTINMAGKLNLTQAATLIRHAHSYIGTDTVMTHIAAAVGTPTVALFGPSNPVRWGPWPATFQQLANPWQRFGDQKKGNVFLLQGSTLCVPCLQEGCERRLDSYSDCLQRGLSAERVYGAWEALTRISTYT